MKPLPLTSTMLSVLLPARWKSSAFLAPSRSMVGPGLPPVVSWMRAGLLAAFSRSGGTVQARQLKGAAVGGGS
jgi:hypothetical protein